MIMFSLLQKLVFFIALNGVQDNSMVEMKCLCNYVIHSVSPTKDCCTLGGELLLVVLLRIMMQ